MYAITRWSRLMFGPLVFRETSVFLLTARVPVPIMTCATAKAIGGTRSADFSLLPIRGYRDLPW